MDWIISFWTVPLCAQNICCSSGHWKRSIKIEWSGTLFILIRNFRSWIGKEEVDWDLPIQCQINAIIINLKVIKNSYETSIGALLYTNSWKFHFYNLPPPLIRVFLRMYELKIPSIIVRASADIPSSRPVIGKASVTCRKLIGSQMWPSY